MKPVAALVWLLLLPVCLSAAAEEEGIDWLLSYDGKTLPGAEWTVVGSPKATVEPEGLRLVDDATGFSYFQAPWQADPRLETVVEATVRVVSLTGSQKTKTASS
ncbi:MAG: hypothetical protein WBE58_11755, partial [Verrucomicrobiales bacterium]